jgi:hypothetical protein
MSKAMVASVVLSFMLGAGLAIVVQNQLRSALANNHIEQGEVRYQPLLPSYDSGAPPEGYYLETTTRFYFESDRVVERRAPVSVGTFVTISGNLGSVCGNDGGTCYPKIVADSAVVPTFGTP